MSNCIMMGTQKYGCLIDNVKAELTHFDYIHDQSTRGQITALKYSIIKQIEAFSHTNQENEEVIALKATTYDGSEFIIPIRYPETAQSEWKTCKEMVLNTGLFILDPTMLLSDA